ncbi:MAG: hypothetical protein U0835_16905 [Isosphaeraceae bacterium]
MHLVYGDRSLIPPADDPKAALGLRKPDGTTEKLDPASGRSPARTGPGYTRNPAGRAFAVNLDPARPTPLATETLEQYGCRLAKPAQNEPDPDQLRQMRNAELEGRQKLWRWVILAAVGVLLTETLLAGRLDRGRPARAEGPSS